MNQKNFYDELISLFEKYGLCITPQENDKYELPIEIVPYNENTKWLYEDLVDYCEDDNSLEEEVSKLREMYKDRGVDIQISYVDIK